MGSKASQGPKSARYLDTHPWITFQADLRGLDWHVWAQLGEIRSKCDHLANVPLAPNVAKAMQLVSLVKGAHATTAIEGNTLTEDQVKAIIERKLELPKSKEYLGQEVENVVEALNDVLQRMLSGDDLQVTVSEICRYNAAILKGLELSNEVVPGEIRLHEVGVGRYPGAPARDCVYLLDRLCEWLNASDFMPQNEDRVPMGVLRAILAHLYIAWIHPFGDGNGRTARLLEFKILVGAGLPVVASHLLSNHYNLTRTEYYRQLDNASRSGGNTGPFIKYAIQGLLDGLREQLLTVWTQHYELVWRDIVHQKFPGESKPDMRLRHVVLALSRKSEPSTLAQVMFLDEKVIKDYATVSSRTLMRDLKQLEEKGLIVRNGREISANKELVLHFRPERRECESIDNEFVQ